MGNWNSQFEGEHTKTDHFVNDRVKGDYPYDFLKWMIVK